MKKNLSIGTSFFWIALLALTTWGCRGCGDSSNRVEIADPGDTPDCCVTGPESECCKENRPTAPTPRSTRIDSVKFFLENSHSMGGYFQTQTDFFENLDGIITDLGLSGNYQGMVHTYTIAEEIAPYDNPEAFRNQLDPTNDTRIAIAKSSPLHTIISDICTHSGDNSISLLVTDGIPSGSNRQLARYDNKAEGQYYNRDFISNLKNDLKKNIDTDCHDFALRILAYRSNYNSTRKHPYFKLDNNQHNGVQLGEFTRRPYYIFAIGQADQLRQFFDKMSTGFRPEESLDLGFSYAGTVEPSGSYLKGGDATRVSGEVIQFDDESNTHRFALLADLSGLPLPRQTTAYLEDNIAIYNNDRRLEASVRVYTERDLPAGILRDGQRTQNALRGKTHIVEVELPDFTPRTDDRLEFRIVDRLPGWYRRWSSDDDLDIQLDDDRSYGFASIVEGIRAAYNRGETSYLIAQPLQTTQQ